MSYKISCICPTYNRCPERTQLIAEAVESFRRQTYSNKELILINDTPGQFLECDVPNVMVINLEDRIPTLGHKYNLAIQYSSGYYICPWEDDDISLPNRLSFLAGSIASNDYCNPRRYWFLDGRGLHHEHPSGYGHNCSMFTRKAWEKVGGYPCLSGPQDAFMDGALRKLCGDNITDTPDLPLAEWTYIYRWGVSNTHLSSRSPDTQDFYDHVGTIPIQQGMFSIVPEWQIDYEKLCKDYLVECNQS